MPHECSVCAEAGKAVADRSVQRGFTVVEALVAAALLGLGISGVTTLALHTWQAAGASRQQATALVLAQNTLECLKSGPSLCPGAVNNTETTVTQFGTVYKVRSQSSSTSQASLTAWQVTVSWQPTGNTSMSPMAWGAGQLTLNTRMSSTPDFVRTPGL